MATDLTPRPKPIYTRYDQRAEAVALLDAAVTLATHGDTLVQIADDDVASVAGEYRAQAAKLIKELDTERLEMTAGARATIEAINAKFNEQIDSLRAKEKAIGKALLNYMDAKAEAQRKEREEAERVARAEQAERERVARIDQEAREAAHAAEVAEAQKKGEEPPPPPPPPEPVPVVRAPTPVVQQDPFKIHGSHGSTTGARDNWKYRVSDISLVPAHLLVSPEERIAKTIANATVKQAIKARLAKEEDQDAAARKTYTDVVPGLEIYNERHLASRTV